MDRHKKRIGTDKKEAKTCGETMESIQTRTEMGTYNPNRESQKRAKNTQDPNTSQTDDKQTRTRTTEERPWMAPQLAGALETGF